MNTQNHRSQSLDHALQLFAKMKSLDQWLREATPDTIRITTELAGSPEAFYRKFEKSLEKSVR